MKLGETNPGFFSIILIGNTMSFKILKQDKKTSARTGILKTARGDIKTPVFMPVGTLGTVKTTTPDELKGLGADIILGNTYHLYLRPGDKEIKKFGGLHDFIKWDRPILTDSGGFQVFSLGREKNKEVRIKNQEEENLKIHDSKFMIHDSKTISKKQNNNLVKITEAGVFFKSHLDGSSHFFTPEKVIDIQKNLGSDIMMVLDECTPYPATEKYAREAMQRTHLWAEQALGYKLNKELRIKNQEGKNLKIHDSKFKIHDSMLFGIIQGSTFKNLREESARFISSLPFDGIAIGGVAVGESKKEMYEVLDWVLPEIQEPESRIKNLEKKSTIHNSKFKIQNSNPRPIYLMGVGTPEDILEAVERGVDMFDCVLPTRLARHATVWFYEKTGGKLNLLNSKFKNDKNPIMKGCQCYACKNGFSRAYIHHLLKENEVLGIRLTTLHNLHFLLDLMTKIRDNISSGTFSGFKRKFLKNWQL